MFSAISNFTRTFITNPPHKRIGTMYLLFGSFTLFLLVLLCLVNRIELAFPSVSEYIWSNVIASMHGAILLYISLVAILFGLCSIYVSVFQKTVWIVVNNFNFLFLMLSFFFIFFSIFYDNSENYHSVSFFSFSLCFLSFFCFIMLLTFFYTFFFLESEVMCKSLSALHLFFFLFSFYFVFSYIFILLFSFFIYSLDSDCYALFIEFSKEINSRIADIKPSLRMPIRKVDYGWWDMQKFYLNYRKHAFLKAEHIHSNLLSINGSLYQFVHTEMEHINSDSADVCTLRSSLTSLHTKIISVDANAVSDNSGLFILKNNNAMFLYDRLMDLHKIKNDLYLLIITYIYLEIVTCQVQLSIDVLMDYYLGFAGTAFDANAVPDNYNTNAMQLHSFLRSRILFYRDVLEMCLTQKDQVHNFIVYRYSTAIIYTIHTILSLFFMRIVIFLFSVGIIFFFLTLFFTRIDRIRKILKKKK